MKRKKKACCSACAHGKACMGEKTHKVMHEYKYGRLRSGSRKGPVVRGRKQAIAIALSEARRKCL